MPPAMKTMIRPVLPDRELDAPCELDPAPLAHLLLALQKARPFPGN